MKVSLIIFLLIPFTASGLTVDEWLEKYKRPCDIVKKNQVCKERLDSSLMRMKNSIVPKLLAKNGLPLWIATVGIIESDYNSGAISRAGAIGVFQVLSINCQTYYTKKRTVTIPMRTGAGLKFAETIIETKPTISACKELLKDVGINIAVASWLLLRLFHRYDDWSLSLMAYNAGPGRIDNWIKGKGKPLTFETLNYYSQLLAIQKYIEGIR